MTSALGAGGAAGWVGGGLGGGSGVSALLWLGLMGGGVGGCFESESWGSGSVQVPDGDGVPEWECDGSGWVGCGVSAAGGADAGVGGGCRGGGLYARVGGFRAGPRALRGDYVARPGLEPS